MLRVPVIRAAAFALGVIAPAAARASFLHGETLDTMANILAWFVIIVMPFVAIGLFLFVHVLPEKIAEKRHHPQKDSIKVLCILSLFFGGLLWPLAWLWAYTRPVMSKAVYGTEKHDDYYIEMGEKARTGTLTADELEDLRHDLAGMAERGTLAPKLRRLREDLAIIEQQAAAPRKEKEKA
jgi:CBS domain containing-hemolysin-like protein